MLFFFLQNTRILHAAFEQLFVKYPHSYNTNKLFLRIYFKHKNKKNKFKIHSNFC